MKNRLNIIYLLSIFIGGLFILFLLDSCLKKNDGLTLASEAPSHLAFNRDATPVDAKNFVIEGTDGLCYSVTVNFFQDNSVSVAKTLITCPAGEKGTLIMGVPTQRVTSNKASVIGDFWYIPVGGGNDTLYQINNGGDIECFCEIQAQGTNELGGECTGGGQCFVDINSWSSYPCAGDICCTDCDARICTPTIIFHDPRGLLISASSVNIISNGFNKSTSSVSDRSEDSQVFYSGNVKIEIVKNGENAIAYRTYTETYNPVKTYNATSISIQNNRLSFPSSGYWFIPFDCNSSAIVAGGGDGWTCVSDSPPCTGECNLETASNGCLECKCTSTGDCDLRKGGAAVSGGGGVFLQASNIQIINQ